ncbi:MAG: hypothetical protein IKN38_02235 [Clostridia bacterium]|nr:hypothetical protein [Clostridia bacterium]
MSRITRTFVFVLTVTLTLGALASCGGAADAESDMYPETDPPKDGKEVTGETMEWGDITVLVPEGYEFKGGDVFDPDDSKFFSVKRSDFSYFDFQVHDGEDSAKGRVDQNRTLYTNGQQDAEVTYNGITWKGFSYDAMGTPAFELYAVIGDMAIKVASSGFDINGSVAEAILGSLASK